MEEENVVVTPEVEVSGSMSVNASGALEIDEKDGKEVGKKPGKKDPAPRDPGVKQYGRHQKRNFLTDGLNTIRNVVSALPTATLVRWHASGSMVANNDEARNHQVAMNKDELKAAQGEVHDGFKYITFVYTYHGNKDDMVKGNKLSEDEKKYIGLETDKDGKITGFLNGSKVVGYLDDEKTGARAVALQGQNGKVTIAIAGGDMSTGKTHDLIKDGDDIMAITAGNLTGQFKQVYDFAKDIEKRFGKVDNIVGHSLGAHHTVALVPFFPNSHFVAYDGPGVTDNMLKKQSKFSGLSEEELRNIYDQKAQDVLAVTNGKNSFNTLGWVPKEITMVDPEKDKYNPVNPKNLMPTGHFYEGGYYKAIRNLDPEKDNGEQKLFNMVHDKNDKSGGPGYITGGEAVAGVGVAAIPVVGPIATAVGAVYGWIAHKAKDNPGKLDALEKFENRIAVAQMDNINTQGAEHQGKKVTQEEFDKMLEVLKTRDAKRHGMNLSVNNVEGKIEVEYQTNEFHTEKRTYNVEFADAKVGAGSNSKGRQ